MHERGRKVVNDLIHFSGQFLKISVMDGERLVLY